MRIVVAIDSFKGSVSADQAAAALTQGLRRGCSQLEVIQLPLADGGEGLVTSLVTAKGGQVLEAEVTGPRCQPVQAHWGWLPDGSAVIEMAAASGLTLIPPAARDPFRTTTRGTGELIRLALDRGARRVVIGLGGSATNDGGAGMAEALGAHLLTSAGRPIGPGARGLEQLERIDVSGLDPRLRSASLLALCDVDNPLCGPRGAAAVYGPQKGARPEDIPRLDAALAHFADVVEAALGPASWPGGRRWRDHPGAGAAGGLGFGLMAFCGARLVAGAAWLLEELKLRDVIARADLVITGEGRLDPSSLHGKLPITVARWARSAGRRVVAVCGQLALPQATLDELGIEAAYALADLAGSPDAAVTRAEGLLSELGERLGRSLSRGGLP